VRYRLRHYQQQARADCLKAISRGSRAPLLVAPTGAGKTVLACSLMEYFQALNLRIIFFAHRTELIEQTSNKLAEAGIRHGVIKSGMDSGSLADRIQVASIQTFVARIKNMPRFDIVIIDECHHAPASTYIKVLDHCRADGRQVYVIGLTATPYRADGKGLAGTFDHLIEVATINQLIGEGFLVPTRLFRGRAPLELERVAMLAGDYDERELARQMSRPKLIGHVVEEYIRWASGRSAVAFAVDVAHSKAIAEAFRGAGVRAEHVDGQMAAGERRAVLDRLRRGQTHVVSNCGVLTEGFDCPTISAVILARPTKSRGLWRQCVGRGLRPAPEHGKFDCLILDHADTTREHGYITDPDQISLGGGVERAREAASRVCPVCTASLPGRPPVCPVCGYKWPIGEAEDTVGLGDAGIRLDEDVFARVEVPRLAGVPVTFSRPGQPRIVRLRVRGSR
jgi:DNA repair protein RadD